MPFFVAEYIFKCGFINKFLTEQSLQIMGTILALNIATASFLVGHLMDIEIKKQREIFSSSIKEVRDNIYFMIALFILQLTSLTLNAILKNNVLGANITLFLAIIFFLTYIFCLFEMTQSVFSLRKSIRKKD